jgi:hypothetical protein
MRMCASQTNMGNGGDGDDGGSCMWVGEGGVGTGCKLEQSGKNVFGAAIVSPLSN